MTSSLHNDGIVRRVLSSVGDPVDRAAVIGAILAATHTGGGTFDQRGGSYRGSGYLVGGAGPFLILDYVYEDHLLRKVIEWVYRAAPVVSERADLYFGAWVTGGLLYLDVTQHYSDEDYTFAVQAAWAREELAIFKADGKGGGYEIRIAD